MVRLYLFMRFLPFDDDLRRRGQSARGGASREKQEIKKAKIHFHCSGEAGRITRLVNPLLGAYMAFCVDQYGPGHEPTQLHLETMAKAMGEIKRLL